MTSVDASGFAPSAIEKAHARLIQRATVALGRLSTAQLHEVIAMAENNPSAIADDVNGEEARLDYEHDNGVNP